MTCLKSCFGKRMNDKSASDNLSSIESRVVKMRDGCLIVNTCLGK